MPYDMKRTQYNVSFRLYGFSDYKLAPVAILKLSWLSYVWRLHYMSNNINYIAQQKKIEFLYGKGNRFSLFLQK